MKSTRQTTKPMFKCRSYVDLDVWLPFLRNVRRGEVGQASTLKQKIEGAFVFRPGEERRMLTRCQFGITEEGCGATFTYPIKGMPWRRNVVKSFRFDSWTPSWGCRPTASRWVYRALTLLLRSWPVAPIANVRNSAPEIVRRLLVLVIWRS